MATRNRLHRLEMRDWKGCSGPVDLGRLNLILGDTGAGKTAILEAVRFAVEGRVEEGGTLDSVAAFCGPTGATVSLRLEDGFGWDRTLSIDTRGEAKLSQAINIHGKGPANLKDANAVIRDHVGDFAPMFRLAEFLGLSPDKRRDFVVGLCRRATPAGSMVAEEHARLTISRMVAESFQPGGVPPKVAPLVPACIDQVLAGVPRSGNNGADDSDRLQSLIEYAKSLKNSAKAAHNEALAAERAISARKAALSVVAETVEQLKERRARIAANLVELERAAAHQRGRQTAIDQAERILSDLDRRIATLTERRNQCSATMPARDDSAQIERLEAHIATARAMERPAEPSRAKLDAAQAAFDAVNARLSEATQEEQAASRLLKELMGKLARMEGDPWAKASDMVAAIRDFANKHFAHVDIDTFAQFEALMGSLSALVADQLGGYGPTIRADVDAARERVNAAMKRCDTLLRELDPVRIDRDQAQLVYDGEKAAWNRSLRDWNFLQGELPKLAEQLATIKAAAQREAVDPREAIDKQIDDAQRERLERDRELTALRAEGGFIPMPEREAEIARVSADLKQLDRQIEDKLAFSVIDREYAECIERAQAQQMAHDVFERVIDALWTLREDYMTGLVAPLVSGMNRFLAIAAPRRTAYCSLVNARGHAAFDIGWLNDAEQRRDTYASLSGGERTILGCALAYAIVCLADPPCRLLLAEIDHVSHSHLHSLLAALASVRDDLSTVIVATHVDVDSRDVRLRHADAWTIIRPDRKAYGPMMDFDEAAHSTAQRAEAVPA